MHWGLELEAPPLNSEVTAGTLSGNKCRIEDDGLVAHCAIGRGQATVIADADFLNSGGKLDLLGDELARLEN